MNKETMIIVRLSRVLLATAFILMLTGVHAYGWGFTGHAAINRAAALSVPQEMSGWHAYADLLAEHGTDPDFWKESDEAERPRHFIDLEVYGVPKNIIPRERPALADTKAGGAPWAITENLERLTTCMRNGHWSKATRVAAALGHYVGDTHQPLHTTENYDGWKTGNGGIHLRWEIEMPKRFWTAELPNANGVTLMEDPWGSITGWTIRAHSQCSRIFDAGYDARRASGNDTDSQAYYRELWHKSNDVFSNQLNEAVRDLSSLWYTAWVKAGSPYIPEPPDSIPGSSIYQMEAESADSATSQWVLVGLLIIAGAAIVVKSFMAGPKQ